MIRKVILALIAAGLTAMAAMAQDLSWDAIKNDPSYISGIGYGETYSEADRGALSDLISKIAVGLSSEMIDITNVNNVNGDVTTEKAIKAVVNTYSQATLTNTKSIVVSETPKYCVVRYISKAELDKIFKQRQDKVLDLVRNAMRGEKLRKIDDALRNYYWSYALLKSLQYPNSVRYEDQGESHLLMTWIPEQIDRIMSNIETKVSKVDGRDVTLAFSYDGQPVSSVDFSYYDGSNWSHQNSVKDGVALIELRQGFDPSAIKLRYEYEYTNESRRDPEIESVTKIFKNSYFKKSEASVGMSDKVKPQAAVKDNLEDLELNKTSQYDKIVKAVVEGVKSGDYPSLRKYFTEQGWDMMTRLLQYGNAKLIGKPAWTFYNLYGDRVVCRGIMMSFSFPNNHKTFTEDVTFTFNSDKSIETVAFGLGEDARRDIFDKGKNIWDEKSMLAIATFLENYKTAFALKRLDYIEDVFDDNAVIIVGSVVKKAPKVTGSLETGFRTEPTVRYNRYNKKEYLKRMRSIFEANEFVNIHFSHNDVVRMGKGGESYGIQIEQDYYSSLYGDTGYLFLIVDINDPEQPIIKLRTWQPERDPNINAKLSRDDPDYGLYGPGMF